MGLYIAYTNDLKERKVETVFLKETDDFGVFINNRFINISSSNNLNELDNIKLILEYTKVNKIDSYEIVLEKDLDLNLVLECLNDYLLDNDVSIGLLTLEEDYISKNAAILTYFGVSNVSLFKNKEGKKEYIYEKYDEEMCNEQPLTLSNKELNLPMSKSTRKFKSNKRASLILSEIDEVNSIDGIIVLEESFHNKFFRFLKESNKSNVEVYKDAGISRQVFSKIISDEDLIPTKITVLSLAIGLELNLKETKELLESAGYSLSKSLIFDSILEKYISLEIYDFDIINQELNDYNCQLLGWRPREK